MFSLLCFDGLCASGGKTMPFFSEFIYRYMLACFFFPSGSPTGSFRVWFNSVQSLDRLGRQGDMTDDSAEIPFQSFLQEAIVDSSDMDRAVHSLMLSIQHFLCRPRRLSTFKVL